MTDRIRIDLYKVKYWQEKQEWEHTYKGFSKDIFCHDEYLKGNTLKEFAKNISGISELNKSLFSGTDCPHYSFVIDFNPHRKVELSAYDGKCEAEIRRPLNFLERTLFGYYLKKAMKKRQNKEE